MPLPNTRMFHPLFEAHHRPVADGQLTAECVVTRPSSTPNAWDDAAGRNIYPPSEPIYAGSCRVQRRAMGQATVAPSVVADRSVPVAGFVVVLTATSTPLVQVNDVVTITVCTGDPALVGCDLKVRDSHRGSITWQRDLICDLQTATTR
jgi:hypothetical protein